MDEITLKVRLHGIVQGVGMRHHVRTQARRHGVFGYVRNRSDGTVECLATGTRKAVAAFMAALRDRPPGRIDRIDTSDVANAETHTDFVIRF